MEVIKRFKYVPTDEEAAAAMLTALEGDDEDMEDEEKPEDRHAIAGLQDLVFSRLERIERSGLSVDSVEVPPVR